MVLVDETPEGLSHAEVLHVLTKEPAHPYHMKRLSKEPDTIPEVRIRSSTRSRRRGRGRRAGDGESSQRARSRRAWAWRDGASTSSSASSRERLGTGPLHLSRALRSPLLVAIISL